MKRVFGIIVLGIVIIGAMYYFAKETTTPEIISESQWRSTSSRSELMPTQTSEGVLLRAAKEGDVSRTSVQVEVPRNTVGLVFDMKFQEKGDGDWLTVTFNNQLLMSFRGGDFFGADFTDTDLPISRLAGKTGILEFALNGYGSAPSSVLIKNTRFIK